MSSGVRWYISSCLQWNVGMCYRQWYGGTSLSSSVVRRYISFIVSGTAMNYLFLCHQWYGGISLHAFSGTLVCVIVSGTAVYLFHRQWYVDELSLFISSVVRWYISLHAFSGTLVCVIVSGTAVHLFHRQWYVDELSLYIISGTVVYLFMPSVERWYVLSSVVRRYIFFIFSGTSMIYPFYIISGTVVYLFHAFSGALVCVIVSGTAVHLFHRQWYVDDLSLLYRQWYGGISLSCLQWNVGMCYRQWYSGTSFHIISGTMV